MTNRETRMVQRKIKILFWILLSMSISLPVSAEWFKIGGNVDGDTFYLDFDRIRKHNGYIYWWELTDYLRPQSGFHSTKMYVQGDCTKFRVKHLSMVFHKGPMGEGSSLDYEPPNKWEYPPPESGMEQTLQLICNMRD